MPAQSPPSIKKLCPNPSVPDPYWQVDEDLIKDKVHRVEVRHIKAIVAKKVDIIQNVQESILCGDVTLVLRVYKDKGQSETGNQ